ncbi:T9SS type A sorting domain-containing protein, partial [Xanthomarina sp.]|uniref:T9SS type A sorting domain-containing protein n=1 Tax=Xanthomarina sp. TaxID=1931211 RepID=UPI002BFFA45C
MKKITLLFLFLLSITLSFGQVLIDENFDAALALPAGWTNNDLSNGGVWTIDTGGEAYGFTAGNTFLYDIADFSGNYAIFNSDAYGNDNLAENAALESPVFDCTGLSVVKLSYKHFILADYGGEGYVEVYNGTSWVEVAYYDEFNVAGDGYGYGSEILDVSTELAGVSNAQVRFRWEGDWAYWWAFDNVVVQQPTGNAPDAVINPTPADGAVNVGVAINANNDKLVGFSWVEPPTGAAASSFNISLGTTPAGNDIGTVTNFNSGNNIVFDWQASTTYYWYITSVNPAGNTASQVWSFTTAGTLGVEDNQINSTFSLYPNPASNVLNIKTTLNINQIDVYNQLGQNVLQVNGLRLQNNSIDISALQQGMYLVKISAEG